jgi:hypothetical protein
MKSPKPKSTRKKQVADQIKVALIAAAAIIIAALIALRGVIRMRKPQEKPLLERQFDCSPNKVVTRLTSPVQQ